MARRAVILLGGARVIPEIFAEDTVICADSGYVPAVDQGIRVDHLVGDMDSIPPALLERARTDGVDVRRFDRDKDLSDGEIALRLAEELECTCALISGGRGGRLDHLVSALFLPFIAESGMGIELWLEKDRVYFLGGDDERNFKTEGGVVSLIPSAGDCVVTTDGLKWSLEHETIRFGSTRGIHNEVLGDHFRVRCHSGSLMVIIPESE